MTTYCIEWNSKPNFFSELQFDLFSFSDNCFLIAVGQKLKSPFIGNSFYFYWSEKTKNGLSMTKPLMENQLKENRFLSPSRLSLRSIQFRKFDIGYYEICFLYRGRLIGSQKINRLLGSKLSRLTSPKLQFHT